MTTPNVKRSALHRLSCCCLLALTVVLLTGCQTPGRSGAADITYDELAQRYNRNLADLDRLWSSAIVRVRYRDDRGRLRTEQGDASVVMIELPDRLALSIGKLAVGHTLMWAGSDGERYWLLNMIDEPEAHVGRHNGTAIRGESGLPLGVSPRELPRLLGLLPLPMDADPARVELRDGEYVVQPSGEPTRVFIDSQSFLPTRVELLSEGEVVAVSRLSQPVRVTTHARSPGAWPLINSRIIVAAPGEDFQMTLDLESATDARSPTESARNRAFANAFNYERLLRAHNIPADRQFNLDQE